jgi:ribosomal protein S21
MSMDNNNNEFEQAFHRFKQHSQVSSVSEDFEKRVFSKIKKKKTQRKVATSVTLGILIFAFLFVAQVTLFHKETEPIIMARPGSTDKEEVPVVEDVIFASSDSRTNYAIEQVAYYEEDDTI